MSCLHKYQPTSHYFLRRMSYELSTQVSTNKPLLLAQDELEDGVRARRVIVCGRLSRGASVVAVLDESKDVVNA